MQFHSIKVEENHQLNIPVQYQKLLHLQIGDEVQLIIENNKLILIPTKQQDSITQTVKQVQKLVKQYAPYKSSMVEELIAERREAAKDE
ncbi:hypothetical protein TI05_06140 [Achromatium sp. WMS3]|nr:hypothetical protein TI05_06140 [Achromatium sp. WMS3]